MVAIKKSHISRVCAVVGERGEGRARARQYRSRISNGYVRWRPITVIKDNEGSGSAKGVISESRMSHRFGAVRGYIFCQPHPS